MGKDSKKLKKKHKKEKKHKSKKTKERKKRYSSGSSGSSDSEEEWVEKEPVPKTEPNQKRDDWMSMETLFSGKTRKELNESKPKPEKEKEFNLLDKPGQSARELNPFWKNGGTGLPPEEYKPDEDTFQSDNINRNTRTTYVVSSNSESSEEESHHRRHKPDSFRRDVKERLSRDSEYRKESHDTGRKLNFRKPDEDSCYSGKHQSVGERSSESYLSHKRKSFRKPDDDTADSEYVRHKEEKHGGKSFGFKKPSEETESFRRNYQSTASNSDRKNPSWKKPSSKNLNESKPASERFVNDESKNEGKVPEQNVPAGSRDVPSTSEGEILTLNQMNELSASILKAELMGNKVLAEELKAKLKEAKLKKEASSSSSEVYDEKGRKVVILTETDSKGFTRPAKNVSDERNYSRKKKKADTHEGNKRVRYFADDDKYSLNDLFEKEKYSSTYDQEATFMKLASQQRNDDMDDEAAFDSARMDRKDKEDKGKRNQAIKKHAALEKALDDCKFCLYGKNAAKDCVVLTRDQVYLAVPSFQSLTDRHCLIIPNNHISSATVIDEDIWNEIMDLRRQLVRAFEKEDEDVIFFESAMYMDQHRHMVLHCVPVPKEIGDTAPIYFKKAILECEGEWSHNKKVVELAGRDVRKAVPKGLPYFAVDFGLQSGYAHVIEDKKMFSHNFAQEIIGGMLDLDHTIWRKPRRDTAENINKKVESLKALINNE